jgi:tetratricopeptide (TPR) repeat protein
MFTIAKIRKIFRIFAFSSINNLAITIMKKHSSPNKRTLPKSVEPPAPKVVKKTRSDIAWEWISKQNYKLWFWISLAVCSVLTIHWASKAGINGDAPLDYEYGVQCLNYYLSWGEDKSCLSFTWEMVVDRVTQKYYGGGFETTFALLQHWFKWDNYYQVRLYYLALWSIALLFFMALIAKGFAGWKGATLALWFTFLSPFVLGQFFWNTKDVPHALGYAITIFFLLRFFRTLPKISIKNLSGIALGIAVALSIRVGGALLAAYVGLFSLLACFLLPEAKKLFVNKQYEQVLKVGISLFAAVVLGMLGGLLFYPNFFEEGFFRHILSGMSVVTDFPQRIPIIFEGVRTDSLNIPWHYLIKMFYITTPIFFLVLLHLAILILLLKWKKIGAIYVIVLLFTVVFPFAYMMYSNAPVYGGWRHVLFAWVTIPAIMAIGTKEVFAFFQRSAAVKLFLTVIFVALSANLLMWNVRNAPYQLAYFNSFVGGPKGAFKKYDTDVLHTATSEGVYWLLNSLNPDDFSEERPLIIAANNAAVIKVLHIPQRWRGRVEFRELSFRGYSSVECDYAVLTTLFATPQILSFFWPPVGIIWERNVDGVVLGCVIDRRDDTDYRGIRALREGRHAEGVRLLEEALAHNPRNYSAYYWMGYGYYRTGDFPRSIEFLNAYKRFDNSQDVNRVLGHAYFSNKQYDEAIEAFTFVHNQNPDDLQIAYMIALCHYEKRDFIRAETFLQQIIERHPTFAEAQNLLRFIQRMR